MALAETLLDRRRGRVSTRSIRGGQRVPASVLLPGLTVLLLASVVIAAGIGAVSVGPVEIVGIILHHLGIDTRIEFTRQQDAVVWAIRVPRVILAVLVGSGL